jgi:hypothetical protein
MTTIQYNIKSYQLDHEGITLDGYVENGLVMEGDVLEVKVNDVPEDLEWNQSTPPDPSEYPEISIKDLSNSKIYYRHEANQFLILFVMMVGSSPGFSNFNHHKFDNQGVLVRFSGSLQFYATPQALNTLVDIYVELERISSFEAFAYTSIDTWVVPAVVVILIVILIFGFIRWHKNRSK